MDGNEIDLRGPRVRIRTLVPGDLPDVLRWRNDPEVTRYWITRSAPSPSELEDWLAENRMQGSWTWAIEEADGPAIGYIDVFGISLEHRHAEIAFMIGERSRWGQGYGKEALSVALSYLLGSVDDGGAGLHKITLAVVERNGAARAIYRSCGFREDGRLREDLWYDDEWHDQILMSVLEGEFVAV